MLSLLFSLFLSSFLSFGSPVNYLITLAGNFGEPRPNHFHGGIDVRTDQVEGKPIFAVANGYVSRITVGRDGFGNAVYVRHPNGITTVYCHLKKFVPQLAVYVRNCQYRNQSYQVDVRLRPTDFPVAQGQLIAVSGNTGASLAPHLHLEFRDTRTDAFIDPLRYLSQYIKDTTPPIAHAFMAYPVTGQGVFCGSGRKQSFGFTSHNLTREFTAWGKVGFGIWANDYMEDSYGRLGIHSTRLTVDGETVFESVVDSIPVHCNRMVNSWGDYEHYCRRRVWYMKSYAEPGNTLPVVRPNTADRGIITFDEERDYNLVYTLTDVFGNSSEYTFTVSGKPSDIQTMPVPDAARLLRHDRNSSFQRPGVLLLVPAGLLSDDIELQPRVTDDTSALSDEWRFCGTTCPLFGWADLSLKLKTDVADHDKLYIVARKSTDCYMGGRFNNGWVTARIRELDVSYRIEYDAEPPKLTLLSATADVIRVSVSDDKSGLRSVKAFVDGTFVLLEPHGRTNVYSCRMADTPIRLTSGNLNLRIEATDNRGNKRVIEEQIYR